MPKRPHPHLRNLRPSLSPSAFPVSPVPFCLSASQDRTPLLLDSRLLGEVLPRQFAFSWAPSLAHPSLTRAVPLCVPCDASGRVASFSRLQQLMHLQTAGPGDGSGAGATSGNCALGGGESPFCRFLSQHPAVARGLGAALLLDLGRRRLPWPQPACHG